MISFETLDLRDEAEGWTGRKDAGVVHHRPHLGQRLLDLGLEFSGATGDFHRGVARLRDFLDFDVVVHDSGVMGTGNRREGSLSPPRRGGDLGP